MQTTQPFRTSIDYLQNDPTFHHPACRCLFAQHDTIGNLADCPFPLQTETFRVLLWGDSISLPDDSEKGYGESKKFAAVEFTKRCGHTVQERIPFMENVRTFNHYGKTFEGSSYSVNDWQRRIEFFRQGDCDVCDLVRHSLWIWSIGEGPNSRAKAIARCRMLLNANFGNWQSFVSDADMVRRFAETKRNGR